MGPWPPYFFAYDTQMRYVNTKGIFQSQMSARLLQFVPFLTHFAFRISNCNVLTYTFIHYNLSEMSPVGYLTIPSIHTVRNARLRYPLGLILFASQNTSHIYMRIRIRHHNNRYKHHIVVVRLYNVHTCIDICPWKWA